MSVKLTSEQEEAAARLVEVGLFRNRDEAVERSHDWLREEAARFEAIRSRLELSLAQSARGESGPLDPEDVMRRVRARMQDSQGTNDLS